MSDTSRETRSGPGRTVIAAALILAVVGLGATVLWRNSGQSDQSSPAASAQPAGQTQAAPSATTRAEASDETKQAPNALEQTVKDLQASQQQMADRLDDIKRKLDAEQGERKMLSEQVGALSARVDSLTKSSASIATGSGANASAKKKR
jgi:predicted membrane-bound mannosyltransferase